MLIKKKHNMPGTTGFAVFLLLLSIADHEKQQFVQIPLCCARLSHYYSRYLTTLNTK
jgi:hypothetical protein